MLVGKSRLLLSRSRYSAARAASTSAVARESSALFEPELIIFDKDGTLIDFKFMWAKWADTLCNRLEATGHLDHKAMQSFSGALGFDRVTKGVHHRSPLCCSPMHEIESICIKVVGSETNLGLDGAADVISKAWSMPDPVADAKPLTDLPKLFSHLRHGLDLKVAVCTTDDRSVTLDTLEYFGVHKMVDIVLCGDEKHVPPKPSPEQILHICKELQAQVSNTVMVGDTITDMSMGRSSNVGLTIGIPGGAGSVEDLMQHADFLLPSMHNFAKVITHMTTPRDL